MAIALLSYIRTRLHYSMVLRVSCIQFSFSWFPIAERSRMAFAWILPSVVAGLLAWLWLRRREVARAPLPPGPKGLPLVGNLNDLPKPGVLEAHHWLEHKKLYGS